MVRCCYLLNKRVIFVEWICHDPIWMSHVPYEEAMSYTKIHIRSRVMPYLNKSCSIWVSRVPYEWVVSLVTYDSYEWISYEWVVSHMNKSYPIWMSHVPYEWVVSHMNGSCTKWMSRVTRHLWLVWMNLVWVTHVSYEFCSCDGNSNVPMNESCHSLKE